MVIEIDIEPDIKINIAMIVAMTMIVAILSGDDGGDDDGACLRSLSSHMSQNVYNKCHRRSDCIFFQII